MSIAPARRAFERLPRERRIGDIADAAHDVFTECGYENASMSAIAERAGVVEGTIYKYFENKRELLNHVLASWYRGLVADHSAQLAGILGTRNRLRFVIWRHLKVIDDDPALCRLFFIEVRTASGYQSSPLHVLNRLYTQSALKVLREGIAAGEVLPDLPLRLLRDLIYGTIEHHTWDRVSGSTPLAVDTIADDLTRIIMGGIGHAADTTLTERLESVATRLERVVGSRL